MADVTTKWSANNVTSPGYNYSAITPSNSVDEANGPFKAIYVGGPGDIALVGLDNVAVVIAAAVAGSIIPLIGRRVNATSTTASLLIGIR